MEPCQPFGWCGFLNRRLACHALYCRRCAACGQPIKIEAMTGEQSRLLKIGDRVCWQASATDLGTVTNNGWGGVVLEWDDGRTSSIHHNGMKEIERVPNKLV